MKTILPNPVRLLTLALCMLVFQSVNAKNSPSAVNFFNGNYEEAKQRSSEEGKLFFLDFYAEWCMPCKWMDQTTFNNGDVADLLNNEYVALKVDIDDIEGFELKKQFDIQYLPTILIFNSKGELIERVEETMPPSKLFEVLQRHNDPANKSTQTYTFNTSPTQPKKIVQEDDSYTLDRKAMEAYHNSNKNRDYRIQVGVYLDHENAFEVVNKLREEFLEPIIVLNDYRDDQVLYKVMMGEFSSMGEAESFKSILKNDFNIDAIVQ